MRLIEKEGKFILDMDKEDAKQLVAMIRMIRTFFDADMAKSTNGSLTVMYTPRLALGIGMTIMMFAGNEKPLAERMNEKETVRDTLGAMRALHKWGKIETSILMSVVDPGFKEMVKAIFGVQSEEELLTRDDEGLEEFLAKQARRFKL